MLGSAWGRNNSKDVKPWPAHRNSSTPFGWPGVLGITVNVCNEGQLSCIDISEAAGMLVTTLQVLHTGDVCHVDG